MILFKLCTIHCITHLLVMVQLSSISCQTRKQDGMGNSQIKERYVYFQQLQSSKTITYFFPEKVSSYQKYILLQHGPRFLRYKAPLIWNSFSRNYRNRSIIFQY